MQDNDICEAAQQVLNYKVVVKTSKVKTSGVQILENWCVLCKIERAKMKKIMHMMRDWLLPSKRREYIPCNTTE